MTCKIVYTKSYLRMARKFFKQHPELENQYSKTLKLLEVNPYHPSLRLHRRKGKLRDFAINIGYRIVLHFIFQEDTIVPVSVDRHDEVYGK